MLVYSQDHSLQEPGLQVEGEGPGSVRAFVRMWSLIGHGQPTPVARILALAAGARHSSHLLRLVGVDLQPHRLSTPCVAWSLENSGHEENALLEPGNHALIDDTSVKKTGLGVLILHKLPFPSERYSTTCASLSSYLHPSCRLTQHRHRNETPG